VIYGFDTEDEQAATGALLVYVLHLCADEGSILRADSRPVAIVALDMDPAEAHAIATLLAAAPALYRAAAAVHDALLAEDWDTRALRDVLSAALAEAFDG